MNPIREFISKYCLQIIVSLETIILFLLVIIPAEYLLTEKYLVYKSIDSKTKTALFLGIFLAIFAINYFSRKVFRAGRFFLRSLFLICLAGIIGNKFYSNYYGSLQQYPRIYSISSDWSIQGMSVAIEGKNFGATHESGRVVVGNLEFETKSWTEEEIVAVQPVPDHFFEGEIIVVKFDNKESQGVPFEIKDPAVLDNN